MIEFYPPPYLAASGQKGIIASLDNSFGCEKHARASKILRVKTSVVNGCPSVRLPVGVPLRTSPDTHGYGFEYNLSRNEVVGIKIMPGGRQPSLEKGKKSLTPKSETQCTKCSPRVCPYTMTASSRIGVDKRARYQTIKFDEPVSNWMGEAGDGVSLRKRNYNRE